jgi:hypothetical protein
MPSSSYSTRDVRLIAYKKLQRKESPLRERILNKRFYQFVVKYETRINEVRPSCNFTKSQMEFLDVIEE